ncbi:MAG TPA: hypothetical protein VFU15_10970, partial [Bacteroidia bacterium]|nr:hypothetical protein [Bacteroidia bacterium]
KTTEMMKRSGFVLLALLLLQVEMHSQAAVKSFRGLSRPEKCWVAAHPFIAKKAFRCSVEARAVSDSIGKTGTLKDADGGQLDAFRHTYWMALLVQEISPRKARKLGEAHEKGNYLGFKKGKQEDNSRADSMACVMDLRNNETGIQLGTAFGNDTSATKKSLVDSVVASVKKGNAVILSKDANGNYLDCEGNRIDLTLYEKKWYVPKCLVKSDQLK